MQEEHEVTTIWGAFAMTLESTTRTVPEQAETDTANLCTTLNHISEFNFPG